MRASLLAPLSIPNWAVGTQLFPTGMEQHDPLLSLSYPWASGQAQSRADLGVVFHAALGVGRGLSLLLFSFPSDFSLFVSGSSAISFPEQQHRHSLGECRVSGRHTVRI